MLHGLSRYGLLLPAALHADLHISFAACLPACRGYYADIPFVSESVYHQVQLSEYA